MYRLIDNVEFYSKDEVDGLLGTENNVTAERERAMQAEQDLGERINDEETARSTEDGKLKASIDGEVQRATKKDGDLDTAIGSVSSGLAKEVQDRKDADSLLDGKINDEASTRENNDTELRGLIDTVSGNYGSLSESLTLESEARENADRSLGERIDGIEASLPAGIDKVTQRMLMVFRTREDLPVAAVTDGQLTVTDGQLALTLYGAKEEVASQWFQAAVSEDGAVIWNEYNMYDGLMQTVEDDIRTAINQNNHSLKDKMSDRMLCYTDESMLPKSYGVNDGYDIDSSPLAYVISSRKWYIGTVTTSPGSRPVTWDEYDMYASFKAYTDEKVAEASGELSDSLLKESSRATAMEASINQRILLIYPAVADLPSAQRDKGIQVYEGQIAFLTVDKEYRQANVAADKSITWTPYAMPGGGADGIVPIIDCTYAELKTLRDNSDLVPGQKYRIKDYTATVGTGDTDAAALYIDDDANSTEFAVTIEASGTDTFNEDASLSYSDYKNTAMKFKGMHLETWKAKYCFDNDTNRFKWADTVNGRGVIYYLEDDLNVSAWYDFYGIVKTNSKAGVQNSKIFLITMATEPAPGAGRQIQNMLMQDHDMLSTYIGNVHIGPIYGKSSDVPYNCLVIPTFHIISYIAPSTVRNISVGKNCTGIIAGGGGDIRIEDNNIVFIGSAYILTSPDISNCILSNISIGHTGTGTGTYIRPNGYENVIHDVEIGSNCSNIYTYGSDISIEDYCKNSTVSGNKIVAGKNNNSLNIYGNNIVIGNSNIAIDIGAKIATDIYTVDKCVIGNDCSYIRIGNSQNATALTGECSFSVGDGCNNIEILPTSANNDVNICIMPNTRFTVKKIYTITLSDKTVILASKSDKSALYQLNT